MASLLGAFQPDHIVGVSSNVYQSQRAGSCVRVRVRARCSVAFQALLDGLQYLDKICK